MRGEFESLGSMALDLPANVIAELAALDEVSLIDNDNDTQVLGHVTTTTGAEQVRTQSGTSAKLNGTGIGIAILDSGLYIGHKAFNNYNKTLLTCASGTAEREAALLMLAERPQIWI